MGSLLVIKRLSIVTIAFLMAVALACTLLFTALVLVVVVSFKGTAEFPVDCGIVFGAAVHKNSTPGPGIRRRVRTATDLYHDGQLQKLYFTGGFGSRFQQKSEAVVMKDLALEYGVEPDDVFVEEKSTSTWENLQYTAPMVQDCESVVGISDRYHLARILLLAHRQGWGSLQTYPAAWAASLPFEIWSVVRETIGLVYYSVHTPGE